MIRRFLQRSVDLVPWSLRHHIRNIPILKGMQQAIVNRVLKGSQFEYTISAGPAKGLRYPITLPDDKMIWTGTWERDFSIELAKLIPDSGICYDIGSHRGFIAGVMAMNQASEVHCFEPNPENGQQIQDVIRLNPDQKIQLHACAVSDSDGEATFVLMSESSMGKLEGSSFQESESGTNQITVKTRSLDSMIAAGDVPPPQLIKIDVEGAEEDVLKGATKTLQDHGPLICLEFHSPELLDSCCNILHQHGYETELVEYNDRTELPANAVGHVIGKAGNS